MQPEFGQVPVFSKYGKKSDGLPIQTGCRWFIGQVKSRLEKRFCHELAIRHISHFIPQSEPGRLMLPGIVFFIGTGEDLYRAKDTRRLWNVLQAKDQIGLRRDLQKFTRFMRGLLFAKPESIVAGQQVRIKAGHILAGETAHVTSIDSGLVRLNIQMVGCAVFHIEPQMLEVIHAVQAR